MKISIVTAYFNRKALFIETLKSIVKTKYLDYEIIAVDDCSREEERIEDLQKQFPMLQVIRLDQEDKWYVNPCIPFNIGIKQAKGEIIVLQNPECLHVHDVLSYLALVVNHYNYVSISTYALNKELTTQLPFRAKESNFLQWFESLPQGMHRGKRSGYMGWYNHSLYRPVYYHFCAALTRENLNRLDGFDERYARGIAFDDDELVDRITKANLRKIIVDDISVIHQYHDRAHSGTDAINRALFEQTKKETTVSWKK